MTRCCHLTYAMMNQKKKIIGFREELTHGQTNNQAGFNQSGKWTV